MNRNLIIVIVGVVLLVIIIVFIFALKRGPAAPSATPGSQGNVATVVPDIVSSMPSDAPSGPTFSLQTRSGAVTIKNFYTTAAGYWPEQDAVALERNGNYTIWYYRTNGSFEIALTPLGTTNDEKAAEIKLMGDLGIDQKIFCTLSVSASFLPGQNAAYKEDLPLSSCTNAF